MQGDPDVLRLLNEQLTSELTAINQYFLHSKMQDNWGFTELAAHTRAESFDEMRHAEEITDRILLLDGLPNYQRIGSLRIGQTLREQFEADLAIEYDVLNRLKPGIVMCREKQDTTSAVLLEKIVADEEEHIDYLETQLELMDKLGEELYSAPVARCSVRCDATLFSPHLCSGCWSLRPAKPSLCPHCRRSSPSWAAPLTSRGRSPAICWGELSWLWWLASSVICSAATGCC